MKASPEDQAAMRQSLERMEKLATAAKSATDTDAVKRAINIVRDAAIDAYELAKAIEDNTRTRAQRELEFSLEQRVGMPAESL
jgi:DNA mismatch repair ATPase MutS